MIQELVNYAEWIKKDNPDLFEGKIEQGVHILISLNGSSISSIKTAKIDKKTEMNESNKFVYDFSESIAKSNVVNTNKCLHNDKYIISNNPFCYKLNLVTDSEIKKNFDLKVISKNCEIRKNKIVNHVKALKKDFLDEYNTETKESAKICINVFVSIAFDILRSIKQINDKILFESDDGNISTIIEAISSAYVDKSSFKTSEKFYKKLNKKRLLLYFDINKQFYSETSEQYFKAKGGLKKSISTIPYQGNSYIINSFCNNDNQKKPFLKHLSAFYKYNYFHRKENDELLNNFKEILTLLPKPLPIFILKPELNKKYITLFKNDSKRKYKEIISDLYKNHKDDLNNYYLFNGNKKEIFDFDYVSSFDFDIKSSLNHSIIDLFKNVNLSFEIKNIFDLERNISESFLFKIKKDNQRQFGILEANYFNEKIVPGKEYLLPSFIRNNIYKYRKKLYNSIYKSRIYLISHSILKDICIPVIHYEIANDESENKVSKNEKTIIRKILLYILLNKIFDSENLGGIDMASTLPMLYDNCLQLVKGELDYYESDEDFAFGTGQLIRYLLELSESNNKNHSMFNPFLQKLGNFDLFISQIKRSMMTYAHKIKMNYTTIDRLLSNTTSYSLREGNSLKDMETVLICGYFAKSSIKEVLEEKFKNNNNDQRKEKS